MEWDINQIMHFLLSVSIAATGGVTRLIINDRAIPFTIIAVFKRVWIALFVGTIIYIILKIYEISEGWQMVYVGSSGLIAVQLLELLIKSSPLLIVLLESKLAEELKKANETKPIEELKK